MFFFCHSTLGWTFFIELPNSPLSFYCFMVKNELLILIWSTYSAVLLLCDREVGLCVTLTERRLMKLTRPINKERDLGNKSWQRGNGWLICSKLTCESDVKEERSWNICKIFVSGSLHTPQLRGFSFFPLRLQTLFFMWKFVFFKSCSYIFSWSK